MYTRRKSFKDLYDHLVIDQPRFVIIVVLISLCYFGYRTQDFKLDASADSLILEHDQDLRFYREINERYESNDYLLMTYTPKYAELFSKKSLDILKRLRNELRSLENVESVLTLLDVPLLRNPPVPFKELIGNIKTLEDPSVNLALAKEEFGNSPIYQDLLIGQDMHISALQINFPRDEEYELLLKRRMFLKDKLLNDGLTASEKSELGKVVTEYESLRDKTNQVRHHDIEMIRAIMASYQEEAELHLGGVTMITDDMITFVKKDLKVFGIGVFLFLVLMLMLIFRRIRWIALTILCCCASTVFMIGFLGIAGWEVTVISSNFISLQLIVTMSLAIHLIVRYRELAYKYPLVELRKLVRMTVHSKWIPCLYTSTTTIAGFCSLMVCDILPVINFGWMMSVGLAVSLVVTFLLFPSVLMLLPKQIPKHSEHFGRSVTSFFAGLTEKRGRVIAVVTAVVIALIVTGVSQLVVENSFINYFHKSTEIYQGMQLVDRTMGGTTPLDIILDFEDGEGGLVAGEGSAENLDGDSDFDDFDEFDEAEDDEKYWLTSEKMEQVRKIHDYLEARPEIGKVLSIETMLKVARQFTDGKKLDNFQLALLRNELPEKFRKLVLSPYISIDDNQARLTVRIKDSDESLQRDKLLGDILNDLNNKEGFNGRVRLSGMMVLYNNMLQSLFTSQISTMGFVLVAIMFMFLVLFKSFKLSLIALFPNFISSVVVLGVMGLLGIPLDMMTITIAAISIGIAVDNTIHYLHRFEREFRQDYDYVQTMHRCHASIGNAMYYTSITIIVGFSILVISNFIPSVLFGLLTGVAMCVALVGALTLLPWLILVFEPFGNEGR